MEEKNGENIKEKTDRNEIYKGNKIPAPIIIVWVILITWGVYYSFKYAIPDLRIWLAK